MNTQKIAILTDSCSDLTHEHIGDNPIYVVPLVISWKGIEYQDGVDITADEVFVKAQEELPKTSLPRREAVDTALEQIKAAGYEKVLAIMLSGGLSGTYNMMRLVAEERSDLEIYAVDSVSASLGEGAIVLQLMDYIRRGFSWERLKVLAHRLVANTTVFLTLDTLEYLKKGGRIGKVTALAGSLLNLKPIISFEENGELGSVAKCRGSKHIGPRMIELIQKVKGSCKHYILVTARSGNPAAYPHFKEEIRQQFPDYEKYFEGVLGSTLSVYTGANLLAAGVMVLDGIED